MQSDSSPKLTLSIWRDFVPPRLLALSGEEGRQLLDSESGLQEEVYSWRPREDVFAGISDDATRKDLRDRLVGRLDVSKPPGERRMAALEDFVRAAEAAIDAGDAAFAPGESESDEDPDDDEEGQVDTNPLLALTMHLRWLLACFGSRPGISVSVR